MTNQFLRTDSPRKRNLDTHGMRPWPSERDLYQRSYAYEISLGRVVGVLQDDNATLTEISESTTVAPMFDNSACS